MSSSEGGTLFTSKFPLPYNPQPQGDVLANLSNMVTPIIDPTTHANIGQGVELDARLLIATHVCKKHFPLKNPIQIP
jgi:hypothetical protein